MPRPQRLPPSAAKVFLLCALALAAEGGYRLFFVQLLPSTAAFNLPPQDLAVCGGSLACALALYWTARLRYGSGTLRNRPGSWAAAALILPGLAVAALCPQWHRLMAPFDAADALPRLAGLAAALGVAACEEIGFRGALFVSVRDWSGKNGKAGVFLALAIGSLGFCLLHACYQSPWDLPFAAAAGLALGVARLRGASLGVLVASHFLMDAVGVLMYSPSLTLNYWPGLYAAGVALGLALALWFLPEAEPPPLRGR